MLGDKVSDLQLRLLAVFNFLFVAVGVINQLQPLFIQNRNIFEAREKKVQSHSQIHFSVAHTYDFLGQNVQLVSLCYCTTHRRNTIFDHVWNLILCHVVLYCRIAS
jgi:ABC-type multidrug transport system permease subunit